MTGADAGRSRIFISYRHESTEHAVRHLAQDLGREFGEARVFLDVASIDPGADFIEVLEQGLRSCAAVLVVIGPGWLAAADPKGRRRLDDPDDWVRREVEASLGSIGVRVFPVLVDATPMPASSDLPVALHGLTRRQAFPLTARHWTNDLASLIAHLRRVPGLAPAPPPLPPPRASVAWQATRSWWDGGKLLRWLSRHALRVGSGMVAVGVLAAVLWIASGWRAQPPTLVTAKSDPPTAPVSLPTELPTEPTRAGIPPATALPVSALHGEWKAGAGLVDRKTNVALKLSFRFDLTGHGEAELQRDDKTTCRGAVSSRVDGGRLLIEGAKALSCSDGSSYASPRIECSDPAALEPQCYGSNPDGSRYSFVLSR